MKKLTKEGVGTETMQAQPLTPEQEEKLHCGALRIFRCVLLGASPCNTVFWYNCKLFGLRGEDEHRSLVREQFEVNSDQQGRFLRFRGPRVFITVNRKTWLVVLSKVTLYSPNKLHQDGWGAWGFVLATSFHYKSR